MSDPYQPMSAGQRVKIPAKVYNAMLSLVQKGDGIPDGPSKQQYPENCIVLVKNNSGEDRDQFAVLGLDAPLIPPDTNLDEFKGRVAFDAVLPTSLHTAKFCILQEPIKDGEIGTAAIAGTSIVRLSVPDTLKGYADVDSGTTVLISTDVGSARVLWADGEGNEQWAIVRFGSTGGNNVQIVRTTGEVTEDGLMFGFIQTFDTSSLTWSDGELVLVVDANA